MTPDDATLRQIRAARPDASTWLSANAGSGKTRVLTDRVARLLLENVRPEHILCLTYTKAAASEMQNRLFQRLGGWAMLEETALRQALAQLGVARDQLGAADLRRARTLFARAIEAPGGLRIQTIHSFCASLLRRFPLEAGVSPQFQEMEDRAAQILRAEILDAMAEGPDAAMVAGIARYLTGDTPDPFLSAICGMSDRFATMSPADLRATYGLTAKTDLQSVLASVFPGDEIAFLGEIVADLAASGSTDQKLAAAFRQITAPDLAALQRLESVLLFGGSAAAPFGAKIGKIPTKPLREGVLAHAMPRLEALMGRVEAARETRVALEAAERDAALLAFAQRFLPRYEAAKQARGWLDFDDLITKARDLLSAPAVAEWVLYRLDGGIDHILVDEAQDTSPVQWQVIERLAQEFTAGTGARSDVRRTIFVVGDKKQSIYSFQGADPREFDRMRSEFADRLRDTDAPLAQDVLQHSFRSAEPILRVVDLTFDGRDAAGFTGDQKHQAFQAQMPGRVDLWPLVEKTKEDDDGPWFEPVDRVSAKHHTVILAKRIAHFIHETIGKPLPGPRDTGYAPRPIHAGDVLILVRTRARLFQEIIRACKQLGLPIAGSDRLRVTAELAVRDIGALLSFLATPEDDLSLATALRSPLFGVSEQALFDLAHRRPPKSYLWEALRQRRDEFDAVLNVLDDLRDQTDFLRPYDLIERVLTRHAGRPKLLGRLGEEAADGINALLQQALAYERTEVPSLTGFLGWMQTDDLQIKRAPDAAGGRIRVMTVHGAKGLEAPIVILPDCAQRIERSRDVLLGDAEGIMWKQGPDMQPIRQRNATEAQRRLHAQEQDRLLYVAMTRAENWLVAAAAGDLDKKAGQDWLSRIGQAMTAAGAEDHPFDFGPHGRGAGARLSFDWPDGPVSAAPLDDTAPPALPAALRMPAPAPILAETPLAASDLGGAKALPGPDNADEDAAMRRGTLMHLLLEHLPRVAVSDRAALAQRLLASAGAQPAEATALTSEALTVLETPSLAKTFAADALTEVPITARLGPNRRVLNGIIDRLIVGDTGVTAIDYKTNRTVPATAAEVPDGILRQMGAYHMALAEIYPDMPIELAILWTATAQYMPLPHNLVTLALGRTTTS